MKRLTKQGFTLIELLVVIAIVGVLAALVTASINDSRAKSRDAARLSQAKEFKTALELYHLDNDRYPCARSTSCSSNSQNNFNAQYSNLAGRTLVDGGYIKAVPLDPLFGTNSGGSQCNGTDSTGYCYCSSDSYSQSYVLSVELESGDRCLILEGPDATSLCTGHQSGRPLCSSI